MKKIIIIVLSLSIILGFLFWKFGPSISLFNKAKPKGPVTLTYWGLWEDENLIKGIIDSYQKQNPNIKINYLKQSSINYRSRVQSQIKEGVGPDVFRIHNSWLSMFLKGGSVASAPDTVFSFLEYKNLFYPIVADSFIKDGKIYAAPYELDGLALFYNKGMLDAIGGTPPKNWQEFIDLANKMTVRDATGIKTAGAAMGTAGNVDHWSDVLGLLLLQEPNVDLGNVVSDAVSRVLTFYTGFITDPRKKVWDINLPSSTQMFASNRLGFYFAPSWRAHELKVANPSLEFRVVPPPQLFGKSVGWASFWAEAVSSKSANSEEAWKFVKYLTSVEAEKLMYAQASSVRLFGEPYSLVSLTPEISADPIVGAFVNQGPNYKFWYLSSNTFDNGINDEMIKYFEDGINATLAGTDPKTALQTVNLGVKQVLDKYTNMAPVPSSGK